MKKTITLLLFTALASASVDAQETQPTEIDALRGRTETLEGDVARLRKLKVSGYVQVQYQNGQEDAALKVGDKINEDLKESFNRIGIRRGRIKFAYEEGIASGVFQLDITENGVKFKDAYLNVKDPWAGSMALRGGIFDRPFGYEISYSSSRRESPERSTVFQTLFPDERDLGAMLILQAPKTSPWSVLKLEAGMFAGNGIKADTDNKKDFIGHLSFNKTFRSSATIGAGVSYYNGKVFQGSEKVYTMDGDRFALDEDESNIGGYAGREYVGFDVEFSVSGVLGMTKLTGEYLFGQQPAVEGVSTKSPNYDVRPVKPTFIRDFRGGYVMLVQDLGRSPLSVVAKYDWYDPNTRVSGDGIGVDGSFTTAADIAVSTIGFGSVWRMNNSLRLTAYYEINGNEKTANIARFDENRKDNVFTLRMQYKF